MKQGMNGPEEEPHFPVTQKTLVSHRPGRPACQLPRDAADRCRSVDQSAPGRLRNFNFISLWRAAEAQSIAPSQAGHGKIIQHLPVRGDKKMLGFALAELLDASIDIYVISLQ
ncbi:hypothetical protein NDU88_005360 [Pleurodeles waltl]|uniref:Uncharacterized protein n=1 Tax=Pleurodeles waltl TaxID=8319 RepID=A0AAV7MB00_PLEWA|nr:hypothetical protein NDU88_005360 [Pleurodeles waltl]